MTLSAKHHELDWGAAFLSAPLVLAPEAINVSLQAEPSKVDVA